MLGVKERICFSNGINDYIDNGLRRIAYEIFKENIGVIHERVETSLKASKT